jgi:hypothetical protein
MSRSYNQINQAEMDAFVSESENHTFLAVDGFSDDLMDQASQSASESIDNDSIIGDVSVSSEIFLQESQELDFKNDNEASDDDSIFDLIDIDN